MSQRTYNGTYRRTRKPTSRQEAAALVLAEQLQLEAGQLFEHIEAIASGAARIKALIYGANPYGDEETEVLTPTPRLSPASLARRLPPGWAVKDDPA